MTWIKVSRKRTEGLWRNAAGNSRGCMSEVDNVALKAVATVAPALHRIRGLDDGI